MSLHNKVAIVTGAAGGIGREYALGFARDGAKVAVWDRADCTETVDLIRAIGADVISAKVDVTDTESIVAAVASIIDRWQRIDVLVNNAAIYAGLKGGRFETLAESDWDACMDVNVKGIWRCCKAVVPHMRAGGGGSIINISSIAATYGMAFVLHYTTSKAAVIGITRGLARELGRDHIRVNAVAPSAVLTQATKEFFGEKYEKALKVIAGDQSIPENLQPQDMVGSLLYLASDASKFVTGQTLQVDGGTVFL